MGKTSRFIEAVEQAYATPTDDAAWLAMLIETMRPVLDKGLGVFGWFYDARDFDNLQFRHPTAFDVPDGLLEAIAMTASAPESTRQLKESHYATPAGPFSRSIGVKFPHAPWRRHISPLAVNDLLVLNAMDPDRIGCAISAPRRAVTKVGAERLALLERVAAHLSTAHRLRRRHPTRDTSSGDAVLSPSGRVEHAEKDAATATARKALTEAVKAAERARGRLRRMDPGESLRIWKTMVAGRWTLVDIIESDGKRFLVAHVNEPEAPRIARLTARERQIAGWASLGHSNKLIAYELGLPLSTIATHLRRAVRKLGLRKTAELGQLFSDPKTIPR